MKETSSADLRQNQLPQSGKQGKSTAGRGQIPFNPIHPSMELPPEQLIRLLSMESKKTRKHMKIQRSSIEPKSRRGRDQEKVTRPDQHQNSQAVADAPEMQPSPAPRQTERTADEHTAQPSAAVQDSGRAPEQQKAPPRATPPEPVRESASNKVPRSTSPEPRPEATERPVRTRSERATRRSHPTPHGRDELPISRKRLPGWLLPACIGVLAGFAVSGFMFWYLAPPPVEQKKTAPVAAAPVKKQRPTKLSVPRNKPAPPPASAPAQAPANTEATVTDPGWGTAVQAERERLRRAAAQRLTEHLTQREVDRELTELQAQPGVEHTPAPASQPSVTEEPVIEQTMASEPIDGSVEPPAAADRPLESLQADEAPTDIEPASSEAPAAERGLSAESSDGVVEESSGVGAAGTEPDRMADSEPPRVPNGLLDVAPPIEQGMVPEQGTVF